ncbi:MAG: lysine--tRNA ligase [Candidatus Paceibacterota bacterium]|jgi:lysyl-tRNA synthetase class 2
MASLEELRATRLEKLNLLKSKGLNPYPAGTARDHSVIDVISDFDALTASGKELTLAGRVLSLRPQGAITFFNVYDGTGKFQGLLKKGEKVSDADFDLFETTVDIGDFVEITGTLFVTKRGEKTLQVSGWKMLTKSLRPLPEKWHGLQDEDEKFRRRYLDILFNEEVRDMFVKRSKFWSSMRDFLVKKGFMEVETPVLENTAGGADAKPFVTHHNALDMDVFLRISPELWLKRLMVAGFPKVFEIGRIFRNEGMDPEHAQDYSQMEFYWAYTDFNHGMEVVKEMYRYIAQETFGTQKFTIKGFEVDLEKEWEVYDYTKTILEKTGVDISKATFEEIVEKLKTLKVEFDTKGFNLTRAIDTLWKYCRKQMGGPGFLINVPVFMEPLAKRSEKNPELVERFQVILAGSEMGKGFSELNDPIDQAGRFADQTKLREAGDEEAQMYDYDFVEALEYGMPPTCGFGVSERLFSFLMNKPVRECQLFPLMKPKK